MNALSNKLNSTTNAFDTAKPAALALTAAAAGIGAGFAAAVNVAADFEHQMSGVKAVMSPDEVNTFGAALSDLAIKLGKDTVFTSREAAAGIEELIKAGVPAQAVLEGAAQASLSLAAATGTPVAEAATVAAQAMNAFGVTTAQLPGIVDFLAGAVNASAADMTDLRFGLQSAAAVAATVGLSFQDATTALGLFANNGLRGQDAGTSLKTMLVNLIPHSKGAATEMRKLGILTADGANAFFDAQGNAKSLAGIAGVLQHALAGMSKEQQLASLNLLFGTDAMRAAAIIAKEGAGGVNTLTTAIGGISASEAAATRLDNLQGSLAQLGGSFETVQIIVGNFFLPVIRKIAEAVKGPLDAFSTMSPAAQGLVTAIIGVTGAAAGVVGGLTLLVPIVRLLGPSFVAVGRVLLSLVPAFRIVALVAGTLAAAWATNLFGIREKVQTAFDAIPGILDRVSKAFSDAGDFWNTTIAPAIQNIADTVGQKFGELAATVQASGLGQAVAGAFGVVGDVFQAIIDGRGGQIIDFFGNLLPQPFKDLGAAIGPQVGNAFGVISDVFQAIIDGRGGEIIDFFGNLLPQPLKDLGAAIGEPVRHAFDAISAIFQAIVSGRGGLVIDFFKTQLPQPFKDLGAALQGPVETAFTAISTIFQAIVSGKGQLILDYFGQLLPEQFRTFASSVGENVGNAFSNIGNIFNQIISGDGQKVLDYFGGLLPQALQDFLVKAGQSPEVMAKLATSITTIQTAIGSFNPEKLATVGDAIGGSFLSTLSNIGTQLAPLLPVFQSIGNFLGAVGGVFAAFAELRARQTAAGEGASAQDPLVSSLQRLADFVAKNGGLGDNFLLLLGPFGAPLQALATNGVSVSTTFTSMTDALTKFSAAILALPPLPDWLQKFLTDPVGAAASAGFQLGNNLPIGSGAQKKEAAFGFGGGAGGGNVINITVNSGPITGEADEQRLAETIAAAIAGSARRVNPPPDNSGNPQLVRSFA